MRLPPPGPLLQVCICWAGGIMLSAPLTVIPDNLETGGWVTHVKGQGVLRGTPQRKVLKNKLWQNSFKNCVLFRTINLENKYADIKVNHYPHTEMYNQNRNVQAWDGSQSKPQCDHDAGLEMWAPLPAPRKEAPSQSLSVTFSCSDTLPSSSIPLSPRRTTSSWKHLKRNHTFAN